VATPDLPNDVTTAQVKKVLVEAINDARRSPRTLDVRLESDAAKVLRKASLKVRRMMAEQWAAA
jgi:hypothetical protein